MTWLGNNFWKSNLPSGTHLSKGKVYLFFNLTIKSLEQSRCCHSAVLVGSFNHDLRITYCWLWRLHWICLEQSSSKKCPKDSEASAFPCCILNNTQFLKTSHGNQKKIMMSRKVGASANKMIYVKDTFLWWRLCIPSIITIAYVVDKQSGICRRYFLLQGLCVSSVKTTTYASNRFKMEILFSNLNGKFWNKSTVIWVGFLGVCLYPLTPTRLLIWKPYLHLNSHTYLASFIYDFLDWSLF